MLNLKHRKVAKYTSLIWSLFTVLLLILWHYDIHSSFIFVENLFALSVFLFVIIVPFVLILLIKNIKVRKSLIIMNISILLLSGIILIPSAFILFNNLITGNGYRRIYKKEISHKRYFSVYLTPDKGALGGNWLKYSIDNEIVFGFLNRRLLNRNEFTIISNDNNNTVSIVIDNDTVVVNVQVLNSLEEQY